MHGGIGDDSAGMHVYLPRSQSLHGGQSCRVEDEIEDETTDDKGDENHLTALRSCCEALLVRSWRRALVHVGRW